MFIEIPANKMSLAQRKLVHGVACNDAPYKIELVINKKIFTCPYYLKWRSMLNRCYGKEYQERFPTYKGCIVCSEWLTFSIFKEWVKTQDWIGKELDKDILNQGNKIYSPKNCMFVTRDINTLLNDHKARRGLCPRGVYWHKTTKKFIAQIKINGKSTHLGAYCTDILAQKAYNKAKYSLIKQIANEQLEPLRSALLAYKIT